jgi:hypothetical protein
MSATERREVIEEIDDVFKDLYNRLTSATNRALLGDMSIIAQIVDSGNRAFADTMLHREASARD